MTTTDMEPIEKTLEYGGYSIRVIGNQYRLADDTKKWIITWEIFDPQSENSDLLIYRSIDADTEMVVDLGLGIAARFAEAKAYIDLGALPPLKS